MAYGLINGFENIDLLYSEKIINSNGEDIMRDDIASFMFAESGANLHMSRQKFGRCQDDGTIYIRNSGGWVPIGRNESKFNKFAGRINHSGVNSMFAQNTNYLSRDPEKALHKFSLLTHNTMFWLVKHKDNKELINNLLDLYKQYPNIAPYISWSTPRIERLFIDNPLKISRCWNINEDFKLSEVIQAIYEIADEN